MANQLLLLSQKDQNYKLLFKYLRAWTLYVAQQRESRIQKEFHNTQIQSSIHRADVSRMQKVIRALLINKLRNKGAQRATEVIQARQVKNLERFYFKIMRKKFVRRQRFQEIKTMVHRYRIKRLAKASLIGWNKVVFQIRH